MSDTITNLFHGEGNPRNSEGAFVELKDGDSVRLHTLQRRKLGGCCNGGYRRTDIVGRRSDMGRLEIDFRESRAECDERVAVAVAGWPYIVDFLGEKLAGTDSETAPQRAG